MNLVMILDPLDFFWTSLINLFLGHQNHHNSKYLLCIALRKTKDIKVKHLCIIINQVRAFICFARPMSHLYQDISVVVILMCGVTCGFCGQTATEADQSAGQRKGKKLSSFTKLYIPRNITHLSQNIKKLKLKLKKLEPTWLCELLKKHFLSVSCEML